jgi:hypothetical protein
MTAPDIPLGHVQPADPLLHTLAPISDALQKRFEYEELVTRFFAFLDRYKEYGRGPDGKVVKNFLLAYVRKANKEIKGNGIRLAKMRRDWKEMLAFVHKPSRMGSKRRVPAARSRVLDSKLWRSA